MQKKEWFSEWFDSKYYHILYRHRDEREAEVFITNLLDYLQLKKESYILDLACGKGRHAATLHQKGMRVLGVDLSKNSIEIAKQNQKKDLMFEVHDMRLPLSEKGFDAVMNLFTSFGYFDSLAENNQVIESVSESLKPDGFFVIDFFNAHKVLKNLVLNNQVIHDDVCFEITRKSTENHIIKEIQFEDQGQQYQYTERVQALNQNDFKLLLEKNNFKIVAFFGDYLLNPYDQEESDRLIVIAKKSK